MLGFVGLAAETGGTIRIAMPGDAPTLDGQISTANIVGTIAQHIYECLVAFDTQLVPQPMLAESFDIQNDGLTYVFHLRHGILFHNGEEMLADDVVASIERWMLVSSRGAQVAAKVSSVTATDDYTVTIELDQLYSELTTFLALANAGAFIMPKEIAEAAGEVPVTEFVGTGPYQLAFWDVGNYVLLTRFPTSQKAS